MSKRDFLDNLSVACNLFVHGGVTTDGRHLDPAAEIRRWPYIRVRTEREYKAG